MPERYWCGIEAAGGPCGRRPGHGGNHATIAAHHLDEKEDLVKLLDSLDPYVGHEEDCDSGSGAPECSCGFDDLYTRVRAAARAVKIPIEDMDLKDAPTFKTEGSDG